MADHPTGIYNYTSVNIIGGTVTFTPNSNNTPVVWLVQSNIVINSYISLPGGGSGGPGGPGGFLGGKSGSTPTAGQGPGGGAAGICGGGNASYGTLGGATTGGSVGAIYGNNYLIPLLGGSGGGGGASGFGGGGGGAMLIASSGSIQLNGWFDIRGGNGSQGGCCSWPFYAGGGSGGGLRLVASAITGNGYVMAAGGQGGCNSSYANGGGGRVRFDTLANSFGGNIYNATFTQGYQPIIIPQPGQGAQLIISSVGGIPVSSSPSGVVSTPDAIISSQQANPIQVVVQCSNIPLNTLITVTVMPVTGSSVSASGYNNTGSQASSTATILLNLPRAGGSLYATASVAN